MRWWVTGRQGRRRRKLLDDLKERRGYSHLKEEALESPVWRARFGRGFGPVVRQTTKGMNEWMNEGMETTWKITVDLDRPQMTIWRMRAACCIREAINTHSKYVILIVFPLQQCLYERAPLLRYTRFVVTACFYYT